MNEAVVSAVEKPYNSFFGTILRKMLRDDHSIVFTHGDLNMLNILVRDGRIVALLDWESAGFYPEYWEYACARTAVDWETSTLQDWCTFLDTCLKPYYVQAVVYAIIADQLLY